MNEPSDAGHQAGPASARADGHDALAIMLGGLALGLLLASPWLVDTSGPEPFYKGPLIFPLGVLALMVASAFPALLRTVRRGLTLRTDHAGFPARGAALFGLICLFPLAIGLIGLQAAVFLCTFGGLRIAGRHGIGVLLVSAAVCVLAHLAFRSALDIWFPTPWILDALSG